MNPTFVSLGQDFPGLQPVLDDVEAAYDALSEAFASGRRLYICGNGGSAADAGHIVGELIKGFMLKRSLSAPQQAASEHDHPDHGKRLAQQPQGGLPAVALTAHTALATAFVNDVAPELIFAQQLHVYARSGDVLLGFSTSGNSLNVIHAFEVARTRGVRTIGLTGRTGGQMAALCDVCIRVPHDRTPRIQERHLPIYHALCIALENRFFADPACTPRSPTARRT
jgi:phosphoheptose isomerase